MSENSNACKRPAEILIVEDSPTQAEQLRHLLVQAGYGASVAADGEAAVAHLAHHVPDVVLSDINMPGMDGYALCRHVKADPALARIPVMLLTSLSDPVDVIRGLEAGADSFTVKPYEREPLLARVAYLLANRHVHEHDGARMGIEITFAGHKYFVNSERLQILNLLLSSYETAVQKNSELVDAKRRLEEWNEQLEGAVQERTQALEAEAAARERVTQALRRNEHSLRIALHSMDLAMFHQDRELRYTWVFRPHRGKPNEYVGRTDGEIFPARLAAQLTSLKHEVMASGQRATLQYSLARGGRRRHYDAVIEPLRDASRRVVGVTGTSLDVTRQVEAERASRAADALFQALIEAAPDPILMADRNGRVMALNGAAERVFGPRETPLVGSDIATFIPRFMEASRQAAAGSPILADTMNPSPASAPRLRGLRPDGSPIPLEARFATVDDATGAHVIAIVRDISERVALEQQIRQTEKMNALGQLTGGIAHDFNNLLGVMLGNLDLLAGMTSDPKMRERIAAAQLAGERGADLTRRLLSFSRRQPLHATPVPLNDSVRNTVEMAARTLGAHVTLRTRLAPELPPVSVDAAELENVLLNLAINGRDAMPDGGEITISTKAVELEPSYAPVQAGEVAAGRYVCLSVTDTGSGMPRDVLKRALEPFFTTKPRGQGTGFGLPMAYGFVKQSNGHLSIYSEVGHGTTVKIYLPLADQAAPIVSSVAPEAVVPLPDGATVLVVDDEQALLEVAISYLEDMGLHALHATDGQEALAVLEREPAVALLLTDVVMPGGMNGAELADRARALRPDLKVVFTTGFPSMALTSRKGLALAGTVLDKPYRRGEFVNAVRQALCTAPAGEAVTGDAEN